MVRNCFDSHEQQPQPLLSKASLLREGEVGEAREVRAGAGSSISVGSRRNREELCSNVLYFAIEKKTTKGRNQKWGWSRECKVREEGAFDMTPLPTGEGRRVIL